MSHKAKVEQKLSELGVLNSIKTLERQISLVDDFVA